MTFLILALITVAGTAAAMALRNAVHCVLALTVGFAGLAGLYLQLDAQFVGFTQILVYVGAVAILAVFAIMMTQSAAHPGPPRPLIHLAHRQPSSPPPSLPSSPGHIRAGLIPSAAPPAPTVTVQQIGDALMHRFVLPLEIIGLLLTAALIGAVVLALPEQPASESPQQDTRP